MLKLYFASHTRSIWTRMLLEEAGAPYELVKLDPRSNDREKMNYSSIHPLGQFPALQDGDTTIIESGAIAAYIADKFPKAELAPAMGTRERGPYYQWLFYPVATLEQSMRKAIRLKFMQNPESPEAKALFEEAKNDFQRLSAPIVKQLQKGPYILGEKFSAADAMVAGALGFARFVNLLEGEGTLASYLGRISERPSFKKAIQD